MVRYFSRVPIRHFEGSLLLVTHRKKVVFETGSGQLPCGSVGFSVILGYEEFLVLGE